MNMKEKNDRIRKRLKKEYPDLSEEDLNYAIEKENVFIGRIRKRLGGLKRKNITEKIEQIKDRSLLK